MLVYLCCKVIAGFCARGHGSAGRRASARLMGKVWLRRSRLGSSRLRMSSDVGGTVLVCASRRADINVSILFFVCIDADKSLQASVRALGGSSRHDQEDLQA